MPRRNPIGTWKPPPCLPPATCPDATSCRCEARAFHRLVDPSAPALNATDAAKLRVFFLDGHSGPLNDMFSTLLAMNVSLSNMDAMLMAQAEYSVNYIELITARRAQGGYLCELTCRP